MRAIIDAQDLREALGRAVAPTSSTLPIFTHAVLEVTDAGLLEITTTDGELMLRTSLEATDATSGRTTANAAMLRAALAGLDGPVELLQEEGSQLRLSQEYGAEESGRRYNFEPLNPDDLPMPEIKWSDPLPLPPETLRAAIQQVSYAAGIRDGRFYLNGVTVDNGHIFASDGHRVGLVPTAEKVPAFILPIRAIKALQAALAQGGTLHLVTTQEATASALVVSSQFQTFLTRLIDHKPVDIFRALSKIDNAGRAVIQTGELKSVVGRLVALMTQAGTKASPILLDANLGDRIRLYAGVNAEFVDYIDATITGGPFKANLNGGYLKDVLEHIHTGTLVWSCPGNEAPQHFIGDECEDAHYIMPMRI